MNNSTTKELALKLNEALEFVKEHHPPGRGVVIFSDLVSQWLDGDDAIRISVASEIKEFIIPRMGSFRDITLQPHIGVTLSLIELNELADSLFEGLYNAIVNYLSNKTDDESFDNTQTLR